ncbi:FMN-binding negative transcriptional regulator [Pantoea sp. Ap-967]|uniref:FMN-binding negative transcriptional regulator n=1 Tax=Pantoea sp. Ap-967 TaxID=2608362 RepID=UPI0014206F82|nr:FMN-binding negative transcriptional regulator [Pantoea sp. Ap-967]
MYVPPQFRVTDIEKIHEMMEQHAFGILFTHGKSGMTANHLPFELDRSKGEFGVLHCHVARKNPVWQDIANGDQVLVVFKAADAYLTPQWLPSKQETHEQVPTWNYMVAHADGIATIHDDEKYVRGVVARLTKRHEAGTPVPWKMTDAPKHVIDAELMDIVGISIEITRVTAKHKLSQNKDNRDMTSAGENMKQQGHTLIGDAMLAVVAARAE